MNNHGDYDTRYDILIGPRDFDETYVRGPAFQFRDVNTSLICSSPVLTFPTP